MRTELHQSPMLVSARRGRANRRSTIGNEEPTAGRAQRFASSYVVLDHGSVCTFTKRLRNGFGDDVEAALDHAELSV